MSDRGSISSSLVLDDSKDGVVIAGITDDLVAAKNGLQAGDELVAATIHLDKLNKNDVMRVLKVLEPYEDNMKVLTKKDLDDLDPSASLGLGLDEKLPGKDLFVDSSVEGPAVSLGGLDGGIDVSQGLGGKINGPTVNGDIPSLSLNRYSADIDGAISVPDARLTGPVVETDLHSNLNTPSASLDIDKPQIKGGTYKAPKFSMPHFNLPQIGKPKATFDTSGDVDLPPVSGNIGMPDLNLSAPQGEIKGPGLDLKGQNVDLNGPDLNLETPNTDFRAPSGNFKWPTLKMKAPKVPDANLKADMTAPDVSLSTPNIDGDIDLPKASIKTPDLKVQSPEIDIDKPSGKFTWPHTKWGKPKLHGPKADLDLDANLNTPDIDVSVPQVNAGMNAPDVDINLPKANLTGPDLDVKTPNIDTSHSINWPHLKWKKGKIRPPKADLDFNPDLSAPDLNLSPPNIDGDINGLNLDVQAPHINAESHKISWPHKKWKLPKIHSPKADFNADVNVPDVDVAAPNVDANLSVPDIDLPKGDIDVTAPEVPSGKLRFPTLKKPTLRFSGPKVNTPDVDLDANVKVPELNASVDSPDVDLKAPNTEIKGPSVKWPTFKKPKWSVSGPKVNGPDFDADVSAPDMNVSAPNRDLPNAELDGTKLDVNAPGVDIDAPSGKFKWLNFKSPKFGTLKVPKADLDADVKVPDVSVGAPDVNLSAPKMDGEIDTPDLSVNMPNTDIKVPSTNLDGPDLNIDGPDGNWKLPKLKLPKLKGPKVKGPDLDADLKAPDLNGSLDLPDADIDMPKVDLKSPDLSLSAPKINGGLDTDLDLDKPDSSWKFPKIKLPDLKGPKVKGPDLDAELKAPDVDASLNLPDADIDMPKVDLQSPDLSLSAPKISGGLDTDLDLDKPDPSWKFPKIKFPDLKGPKVKGPDLDAELKAPDIDAGLDLPNADIDMPKVDLETPDLALSAPKINGALDTDLDVEGPDASWKFPHIKFPKLKKPKVKGPDLDAELKAPDIDASLDLPDADVDIPKVDLKSPDLSLSAPKIDGNLDTPDVDFQKGDIDLQTPDIDASGGKFKLPKMKLPKFNLSGPKVKEPTIDVGADLKSPDLSVVTKVPTADLTAPDLHLKTPGLNTNIPNLDAGINLPNIELAKPNLEGPTLNIPQTDLQGPKLDIKTPKLDGNLSPPNIGGKLPQADLQGPDVTMKSPDLDMNLSKGLNAGLKGPDIDLGASKLPHFNIPKVDLSGPNLEAPSIHSSVDTSVEAPFAIPSADANISTPNVDLKSPGGAIKGPQIDVKAPDVSASVEKPRKSLFKFPKFSLSGSKSKSLGNDSDENMEDGSGIESDVSNEFEIPAFKYHTLPRNSIDIFGGLADAFGISRQNSEEKDYMVSKGVRLPVVNTRNRDGEKIDIMERLKMAKDKVSSANATPTENKEIDLKSAHPSLDSSLVRGDTFKVEKPEGTVGLGGPEISSADENDKFSLSLSNMLGLNSKD